MKIHDWNSPDRASRLNAILAAARKTAGYTQSDAAFELNYSVTHFQHIEKGRQKPSINFLASLIELYRIQDSETINEIWRLARGHAAPGNVDPLAGMRVDASYRDLVLQDIECMSYLTDGAYNVLACNQLWADVLVDDDPMGNIAVWAMTNDRARGGPGVANPVLTDWETNWAPYFVSRLERVAELSGGKNIQLNQVMARINAEPRAWNTYSRYAGTSIHSDGAYRPFFHPRKGPGYVRLFPVTVAGSTAAIMRMRFSSQRPTVQTVLTAEGEVLEEIA